MKKESEKSQETSAHERSATILQIADRLIKLTQKYDSLGRTSSLIWTDCFMPIR
ncbi:MAG: hypothetical protein NZ534_00320 [Bacteroidia bacterium]|nr:hypothetical protein [Bacteroidia bacterium]